jgi:hypothetical protein
MKRNMSEGQLRYVECPSFQYVLLPTPVMPLLRLQWQICEPVQLRPCHDNGSPSCYALRA